MNHKENINIQSHFYIKSIWKEKIVLEKGNDIAILLVSVQKRKYQHLGPQDLSLTSFHVRFNDQIHK